MSDLGRHRGKHRFSLMSLTPITFDANTFSCCGGSYFATIAVFIIISCRRPLNLVGPSMPIVQSLCISATITYGSDYVPLQNCLLPLSLPPLRALHLSTSTFFSIIFLQSYITWAWGMPASFVHTCILLRTLWKVGFYRFLSSPKDFSTQSHSFSLLQHHSQ